MQLNGEQTVNVNQTERVTMGKTQGGGKERNQRKTQCSGNGMPGKT